MHSNALVSRDCGTAKEALTILRQTVAVPAHRKASTDRWLWRGQADAKWELVPVALRRGTILGYTATQHIRVATGVNLGSTDQWKGEYFAIYEFVHLADKVGLHVPGDCPESPDSYPGDMLKEELGISINFGFGFRFWESIPWIPEILKGVNHLLGKSSRDAVFYFNGEYIYLVRRGGRLYLNNDQGEWTSDWLQFITHPYEMIKLPILGMIDRSAQ